MSVTTTNVKGIYADQTFPVAEYIPNSLFLQAATIAGEIQGDAPVARVPYVDADPSVGFVPEGTEIGESEPTLNEAIITTAKLAVLTPQSREASSFPSSGQLLTQSLTRTLQQKSDWVFLQNPKTQGQPTGLVNYEGVKTGKTWAAGDTSGDLDALAEAISIIETNGGTATHFIMSPSAWLHFASLKNTTDNYLLGQPGTSVTRQLWGVPVLTSTQAPDDKIIALDRNDVIAASTGLDLAVSDQAAFSSDSLLWRCVWRLGWTIVHPERVVVLSKAATQG